MSKNKVFLALVGVVLLLLIVTSALGYYAYGGANADLPVTEVENFFLDVDGNGYPDLVLYAQVVFNSGDVPVVLNPPK